MAYVVDFSIVSELMKKDPNPHVIDWAQDHNEEVFLTTVTLSELEYGIMRMPEGKRKGKLASAIRAITDGCAQRIYEFDALSASQCAALRCKAHDKGIAPQLPDCMIAAICLRNNAILVTHRAEDFACYDIEVFDPWDYESPVLLALKQRELDKAKQMKLDLSD